jgi:hypothetical protein
MCRIIFLLLSFVFRVGETSFCENDNLYCSIDYLGGGVWIGCIVEQFKDIYYGFIVPFPFMQFRSFVSLSDFTFIDHV